MRNTKSDEPTLSEKILALYSKDGPGHDYKLSINIRKQK